MSRPKRMIVTGSGGTIGSAMVAFMKENHPTIEVISLRPLPFSPQRLHDAIKDQHIDYFVNAAAMGSSSECEEKPWECLDANLSGAINQLEIIKRYSPSTRWIGFGTSQEDTHSSLYSASKRALREVVEGYRKTYGLYVVIAKLGMTESCKRPSHFLSRKITSGVARISKALLARQETIEPLQLRDINERHIFTHADDVADGVWRTLNQETFNPAMKKRAINSWGEEYGSGEGDWPWHVAQQVVDYALISSETASVREFVELSFKETGFRGVWRDCLNSHGEVYQVGVDWPAVQNVVLATHSNRPKPYPEIVIDASATTDLGWQPQVSFPQLVQRLMACEMGETVVIPKTYPA